MSIEETARGLYVLALISVILFGVFIAIRYRPPVHASLSQVLGSSRINYITSATILTLLAGVSFYGLTGWFLPYHSLPRWSLYLAVTIFVLIVLLAWLPTDGNTESSAHKIHFVIGGVLGICLMVLTLFTIHYSNQVATTIYWITLASAAYCTMCYFLYFLIKKTRRWFLALELVAIGSMLFTLLLLAY